MTVTRNLSPLTSLDQTAGVGYSSSQADPLTVDLQTFHDHLSINTTSAFVAAQEAVKSFDKLSETKAPSVFIYTGNILNYGAFPPFFTLGVGKAASCHLVEYFSKVYREKGYGYEQHFPIDLSHD